MGMVEALKTQEQDAVSRELSFLERLGMLVDQRWNWRENQALGRRLKIANPQQLQVAILSDKVTSPHGDVTPQD